MTTDTRIRSTAFAVEITATTRISAPAHEVWSVLADTPRYPEWNPFVKRFDGRIAQGEKIQVELDPTGSKPQRMTPRIVEAIDGERFTWVGHVGFTGVFDGRHTFRVESTGPDSSVLVQHEVLSGALVPLFRRMLTVDTPKAFARMNDALAARVNG